MSLEADLLDLPAGTSLHYLRGHGSLWEAYLRRALPDRHFAVGYGFGSTPSEALAAAEHALATDPGHVHEPLQTHTAAPTPPLGSLLNLTPRAPLKRRF